MKIKFALFTCILFYACTLSFGQEQPNSKALRPPAAQSLPKVGAEAPPPVGKPSLVPVEAQAPPAAKPGVSVSPATTPASTIPTKPAPPIVNSSAADSPRVIQSNDDYTIWRNGYLRRLYENQLTQSWIIFVLVLLLVAAGLFFSWLQFQHAFLLRQVIKSSAATQADPSAPAPTQDELTFGKDGVVIRSAYLGVIILVISMAFFFLYLKYVYLIS